MNANPISISIQTNISLNYIFLLSSIAKTISRWGWALWFSCIFPCLQHAPRQQQSKTSTLPPCSQSHPSRAGRSQDSWAGSWFKILLWCFSYIRKRESVILSFIQPERTKMLRPPLFKELYDISRPNNINCLLQLFCKGINHMRRP